MQLSSLIKWNRLWFRYVATKNHDENKRSGISLIVSNKPTLAFSNTEREETELTSNAWQEQQNLFSPNLENL